MTTEEAQVAFVQEGEPVYLPVLDENDNQAVVGPYNTIWVCEAFAVVSFGESDTPITRASRIEFYDHGHFSSSLEEAFKKASKLQEAGHGDVSVHLRVLDVRYRADSIGSTNLYLAMQRSLFSGEQAVLLQDYGDVWSQELKKLRQTLQARTSGHFTLRDDIKLVAMRPTSVFVTETAGLFVRRS